MMGNTPKDKLVSSKTDINFITDSQNEEVQKNLNYYSIRNIRIRNLCLPIHPNFRK